MNAPAAPALAKARPANPLVAFQNYIDHPNCIGQFKAALPAHVTPERFLRVVKTSVALNPALLSADRTSLMLACTQAAQDGLVPNGKEAALVIYRTNNAKKGQSPQWVEKVQYMPMIRGLFKLARNSKEMATLYAHVVYEKDEFFFSYGFETELRHVPYLGEDRGLPIAVYACATTKDGERDVEVMSVSDINKIRDASSNTFKKFGSGPWKDWWDEMARKTVMRRLLKRLPMSEEVERAIERDDAFYEMDQRRKSRPQLVEAGTDAPVIDHEATEGVVEVDASEESALKIAVHPTPDGKGTDWVRWEADISAALLDCEHVEDVDALAAENADALAKLAMAYPKMAESIKQAIYARGNELAGGVS